MGCYRCLGSADNGLTSEEAELLHERHNSGQQSSASHSRSEPGSHSASEPNSSAWPQNSKPNASLPGVAHYPDISVMPPYQLNCTNA